MEDLSICNCNVCVVKREFSPVFDESLRQKRKDTIKKLEIGLTRAWIKMMVNEVVASEYEMERSKKPKMDRLMPMLCEFTNRYLELTNGNEN